MQLYIAHCTKSVLFVTRGYFICGEYRFYILYLWRHGAERPRRDPTSDWDSVLSCKLRRTALFIIILYIRTIKRHWSDSEMPFLLVITPDTLKSPVVLTLTRSFDVEMPCTVLETHRGFTPVLPNIPVDLLLDSWGNNPLFILRPPLSYQLLVNTAVLTLSSQRWRKEEEERLMLLLSEGWLRRISGNQNVDTDTVWGLETIKSTKSHFLQTKIITIKYSVNFLFCRLL